MQSPLLELWRTLEVPDGVFLFLIMMGTGKKCPKQPMLQNSAFYIENKGAKHPYVLQVLGWSCGGIWMFLTWILVPDHDGDWSKMSQTTYVPKFIFLP